MNLRAFVFTCVALACYFGAWRYAAKHFKKPFFTEDSPGYQHGYDRGYQDGLIDGMLVRGPARLQLSPDAMFLSGYQVSVSGATFTRPVVIVSPPDGQLNINDNRFTAGAAIAVDAHLITMTGASGTIRRNLFFKPE